MHAIYGIVTALSVNGIKNVLETVLPVLIESMVVEDKRSKRYRFFAVLKCGVLPSLMPHENCCR